MLNIVILALIVYVLYVVLRGITRFMDSILGLEGDDMETTQVHNLNYKRTEYDVLGTRYRNGTVNNISHKKSYGNNNWKQFIDSKVGDKPSNGRQDTSRVPLMKAPKNFDGGKTLAPLKTAKHSNKLTNVIAMDCEMVGIRKNGSVSVLARVSIVNSLGHCVYDKYVKSPEPVTDYRTFVSGIRPHHVANGEDFEKVRSEVAAILRGRILVGHALKHDMQALKMRHPWKMTRDTVTFQKFRKEAKGSLSLKSLTEQFLNLKIQSGEHDSIEDARAALQLYMMFRAEWEQERREMHHHRAFNS